MPCRLLIQQAPDDPGTRITHQFTSGRSRPRHLRRYALVPVTVFSSAMPPADFFPTNHPLKFFTPGYLSRRYGQPLEEIEMVALDLETTGLKPGQHGVVEVAAIRFRADGTVVDEYATRVRPSKGRARNTTQFHGLGDEDVASAPSFEQVWPSLACMLDGAVVLAHNLRFEDQFLRAELARAGIAAPDGLPGVCTMVAYWTHLYAEGHSQKSFVRRTTGRWPKDAHTAMGDVRHLYAAVCGLHQQVPGLCYAGPDVVSLEAASMPDTIFARPILDADLAWNSLPVTTNHYPLSDSVSLAVAEACRRQFAEPSCDVDTWLVDLMKLAGVGGEQFVTILGTALGGALVEGPEHVNREVLDFLSALLARVRHPLLPSKVTEALASTHDLVSYEVPVLGKQRWRVPKGLPNRDELVSDLQRLGARVLVSPVPDLDVAVHDRPVTNRNYTESGTNVVDSARAFEMVEEAKKLAATSSQEDLRSWLERQRAADGRAQEPFALGTEAGSTYWDVAMAMRIRETELDPGWRFVATDHNENDEPDWKEVDRHSGAIDTRTTPQFPREHPWLIPRANETGQVFDLRHATTLAALPEGTKFKVVRDDWEDEAWRCLTHTNPDAVFVANRFGEAVADDGSVSWLLREKTQVHVVATNVPVPQRGISEYDRTRTVNGSPAGKCQNAAALKAVGSPLPSSAVESIHHTKVDGTARLPQADTQRADRGAGAAEMTQTEERAASHVVSWLRRLLN